MPFADPVPRHPTGSEGIIMKTNSLRRLVLAGIVAATGLALAWPAAAQFHGIQIQGVCSISKVGDEPTCTFRIGNTADTFLDDVEVQQVWAVYDAVTIANPAGDNVRDPAAGNLPIFNVVGTPSCAPGPTLPCVLNPGEAIDVRSTGYTVQPGDPDPLPIRGFAVSRDLCNGNPDPSCNPNALDEANLALASNVFHPAIDIEKSANKSLSKIGDQIQYTITLSNNSSADTPAISCSVIDSLFGDISGQFPSPLPLGNSVAVLNRVVQGGDPNPIVNTVTADCSIAGFSNELDDSDSASVALFTPAIAIDKTADRALAKVGDTVNYTLTLSNNSSANTPALSCTLSDSLLGNIAIPSPLPLGNTVVQVSRDVQGGDADPLVNEATLDCSVAGFPNVLTATDSASVNLFGVAIDLDKVANVAFAKVGDTVNYTLTASNDSAADAPALSCTLSDSLLGPIAIPNPLPLGDTVVQVSRDVQGGDPDPLVNTATLDCNVVGFSNTLTASDGASVDLLAPGVEISKQCSPPLMIAGDVITWRVNVLNTGDANLDCTISDPTAGLNENVTIAAAGAFAEFEASRATTLDDVPLLSNTASVSCTLSGGQLTNVLTGEATADCEITEPDIPDDGICRTPGFWGTHGGTEKKNSTNLTQLVIAAAGGSLSVCGEPIDNTNVGNVMSALEAICVSVKGTQRLQLARQLTALALNCVISGGDASCGGTDQAGLFADANSACIANSGNLSGWIGQVDCHNNGGEWNAGIPACTFGTFTDGSFCTHPDQTKVVNGIVESCAVFEDNCHERELSESEVFDGVSPLPGPAGSSNACNAATNNSVNIFQ